ncbi:alpha-D-ribose 1-methylphosphonate 5-triphosphate synthase subunit PhnH [Halomicrobium zhouii]|uniref:Alpha-D-ribose 1-methylphosphonate 5-triphosphate synthase subunit PhnH n=1 Tax=Halomicrobium zhouii TaxID=767519 RepID=A0A1I6KHX6_9EURY|nr:phosphonate C-P lyase system protein PhnH [Halomicrobium zhouii]SFR90811.1 alpha-D-ribose 1-methylphosphonate 5-triphosphate synthase subunit PhnH [Halomicrobium zhouii]
MRALGIDPVHDTRATFRALCDATSRPGTVADVGTTPAGHAILATVVDHEVRTWTDDDALRSALESRGRFDPAEPAEADLLHTHGQPDWDVRECSRGSLVEPSDGATVVYRVDGLEAGSDSALTIVELTGPGVDGTRRLSVGLPAGELERLREAQSTYPRGVDAYLASERRVAAIPRSNELEVV